MHQRQYTFNFTDGGEHRREVPPVAHRKAAAAGILERMTAAPLIQQLISNGQVVSANHMEKLPAATFVRDNRAALKRFVHLIASGNHTRCVSHQEAAWSLLQKFDTLDDYSLALELKKLGLCDSTTSFGAEMGSFRYLLFEFREVMGDKVKR